MSKIGRNQPCPCGSGNKYKKCCGRDSPIDIQNFEQITDEKKLSEYDEMVKNWDGSDPPTFMEAIGSPNKATDSIKEIKQLLKGKNFNSIEEYNRFLNDYNKQKVARPLDDFLGLNPEQMHRILNSSLTANSDLLSLNINIEENDINNIPILTQMKYFLEKLNELSPLKATQKGNLPQKFVKDIYENIYTNFKEHLFFRPRNEEDSPTINSHRHILIQAGIIKKRNNKFSLTISGSTILEKQDYSRLYEIILKTFTQKFNWGFADGYSNFSLIQAAAIFNLYILKNKANNFIEGKELGEIFLKAFPDIIREETSNWREPGQEVINCFVVRFLQRFAFPFGFVAEKKEGEKRLDWKYYYKTTKWFNKCLVWGI